MKNIETPSQTKLNKQQREQNLKGVFLLTKDADVVNKTVILVDDVINYRTYCLYGCRTIAKRWREGYFGFGVGDRGY